MDAESVYQAACGVLISFIFIMIPILEARKNRRITAIELRLNKGVSEAVLNQTIKSIRVEIRQQTEASNRQLSDISNRLDTSIKMMIDSQASHNDQFQKVYSEILSIAKKAS